MNQLQALYQLQELESSLDAAQARVAEIESMLANDQVIGEARSTLELRESEMRQAQAATKDIELDLADIDQKLHDGEALLYSGSIKNPKELHQHQQEIESLKRRRATRATDQAAAMEAHERAKAVYQAAQETLETVTQQQQGHHRDLAAERETLNKKMSKWLKQRKVTKENIDENHYRMYKKIKTAKHGIAVARLMEDACSICRVDQNQTIVHQVRHDRTLVLCRNCGRILVDF